MNETYLFGRYLKDYREANGLSVSDLHKITGVSQPYLSQLENGTKSPSTKIIHKIASGLANHAKNKNTFGKLYKELLKTAGHNTDWYFLDEVDESVREDMKQINLIEQSIENYKNNVSTPIYLNKNNEGNFYFFKDDKEIDEEIQQKIKNIIKTMLD